MSSRRDKYALDSRPLAVGGQAEVFRAKVKQSGEFVAFKRILNKHDQDSVARMKREINVQKEVKHHNIMPILDHSDSFYWYTMPLALKTVKDLQPPIRDELILSIVTCVAEALMEAHSRGYVHRDIKPSNILLLNHEHERWVISDWGLVRTRGKTTEVRTSRGFQFGTAGYAPPELAIDAHSADESADVFSLGRVVAWCLTGEVLIPNLVLIPKGVWGDLVEKTTKLRKTERLRDMEAVIYAVEKIKKTLSDKNRNLNLFEPIRVTDINYEDITLPKGDGTRGSALYSIPFKLSRVPSAEWENFFIEAWNDPPKFTTMHRKGIAQVIGDTIELDGTTIEEVKKYHFATLKLAVDIANRECIRIEEKKRNIENENLIKTQAHKENVRDVARDLNFD